MSNIKINKSDKLSLKPIKDRVYWSVKAGRLFKETHQRIGRLEEDKLLFYLLKHCSIQTDRPYVTFGIEEIARSLPDVPDDPDRLKEMLHRIGDHSFWIATGNGAHQEMLTGWIRHAIYDQETREFTVTLSSELYPYIVSLHDRFQYADFAAVTEGARLKSKYSSRLYELFRIHKKVRELPLTLEQLRYLTGVDDGKLGRWVDLKRRVIDPAINEINQTGCFIISYEPIKSGRAVTGVCFTIGGPEESASLRL
ncbi:MAG: replication initiation protein [Sporolactobacillus sp.]|jgi:hypothetical protein|nr:replication initiation protein [Sporolactobacillus sp.]